MLVSALGGKGGRNVTFSQLTELTGRRLRVSVTDVHAGRHAWLDEQSTPDLSVAEAVRASSAVPFIYPPVLLDGRLFVDGGLLRNLPFDAFDGDSLAYLTQSTWRHSADDERPWRRRWRAVSAAASAVRPRRQRAVLALSIRGTDGDPSPTRARDFRTFAARLLGVLMWGGDSPNAFPEDAPHLDVVRIDTVNVSAADFALDGPTRARLIASGWRAVSQHLVICGHVNKARPPPDWLVQILANYSKGELLELS
mmetsp:Transcript_8441/g.29661  ORF Transcript_8441/g.29661 Transcript_8441/m.29661 type:complete len:253 (+) Transcript_8441:822-1580(+)